MRIRPATEWDLPKITEIYNFEVVHGTSTFDTKQKTTQEQQQWFQELAKKNLPVLVLEEGSQIVGWAALMEWSPRAAYAKTVEHSLYIDEAYRRKGHGKALLKELLVSAKTLGFHTVIGKVTEENTGSVAIHEKMGFFRAGVLREVGQKFGRQLSVVLMQIFL